MGIAAATKATAFCVNQPTRPIHYFHCLRRKLREEGKNLKCPPPDFFCGAGNVVTGAAGLTRRRGKELGPLHVGLGRPIVKVVIMPDHLAVLMAKPVHQDLLRHIVGRGH